jgi:hypothetical protein
LSVQGGELASHLCVHTSVTMIEHEHHVRCKLLEGGLAELRSSWEEF